MTEPVLTALVQRIESLERDNRRWKRGATLAVLLVAAAGLMGHASTRTVDAHKYVLRDAENRPRAELAMDGKQSLALRFKDESGMPRLTLGIEGESAVVVLNDKSSKPRATLTVLPHGTPSLTMYDEAGKVRAELALSREGTPALSIIERDGLLKWKTP
jgi:hypothetical protein